MKKSFLNKIKFISFVAITVAVLALTNNSVKAETKMTPEGIIFDSDYYAATNPNILEEYGNTFDGMYRHYLEHGREEGKFPTLEAKNIFAQEHGQATSYNITERVTVLPEANRIYVGDSRTFVMHNYIGNDGASWMGFPGERYETLVNVAVPIIDKMSLPGKQIVILFGINDITTWGAQGSFNNYNQFLRGKAQSWINKGAKVYFANVIGIDEGMMATSPGTTMDSINYTNGQVATFNKLMAGFPENVKRINISVGKNPFYDGIHYTPETCRLIYNQINKQL